jgi:osmotically-inducible protein OsmY
MDAATLDDEVSLGEESVVEDESGEDAAVGDLVRELPVDDELAADVIEQLRDSNVPAGDRLRISAIGSIVTVHGEVESIDVLEELLGLIGDVPGVEQVNDEVEISGV